MFSLDSAANLTVQPQAGALDRAGAEKIFASAVRRYAEQRRGKVEAFVEDLYSLAGSLKLHRHALGHDLWRAPANIALAVPFLAARGAASAARRLGRLQTASWLDRQKLSFPTDVAREIEWRLMRDFLELPYAQADRQNSHDALALALFGDRRVALLLEGLADKLVERGSDPSFRHWLEQSLMTYSGSRVAVADLTNSLIALSTGALALHQLTPGVTSLAQALGQAAGAKVAASFPLSAGLWSLPGAMPFLASGTTTVSFLAFGAIVATFSGVVTDPLQRRLGWHQRRLHRLVDALERELLEGRQARFVVRDHYAARLLDLMDLVTSLKRA